MKLYFYILKTFLVDPHIKVHECDVIEKPKTFYPVTKFPSGVYCEKISKHDIGCVSGYSEDRVILLQPNIERAKKLFFDHHMNKIEVLEAQLANENRILKIIASTEGE